MRGPTCDHGEILAWAQRQGAVPAEVVPRKFDSEPSIMHFLFGRETAGTPEIHPITWEDFFARFDLLGLQIVFDESPYFELLQGPGGALHRRTSDPF